MKYLPYIYNPDKCIESLQISTEFLSRNLTLQEEIMELGWVYHSVGEIIPQTTDNYWSGHFFPFSESWKDLQISYTQCLFGLYKQAFTSLRSGLELGILSIYYNINDEGHKTIADWYESKENPEANTPRAEKIWKIILSNSNFKAFNERYDLKSQYYKLGDLHNYVHTKGIKYSNSLDGIVRANFPMFAEDAFHLWLSWYKEVIAYITTLHLIKYPLSVIEYDYSKKFGIDIPNFGGLMNGKLSRIEKLVSPEIISTIQEIGLHDEQAKAILHRIHSLPDLTDEDIEEQAIKIEKMLIKHGEGFIKWEIEQKNFMQQIIDNGLTDDVPRYTKEIQERIEKLRIWATENGFIEPRFKMVGNPGDKSC
jgi:hypothetical protein